MLQTGGYIYVSVNNMALVYNKQGDYSKALNEEKYPTHGRFVHYNETKHLLETVELVC
jgi:hypothetical protein